MPTYAECGGLMYLCEQIVDFEQQIWPMVGVLPTTAVMGGRLTLGYRQAIAQQASFLFPTGTKVYGHEFHRSTLTIPPNPALFHSWRYDQSQPTEAVVEGWRSHQVHASYLHLHWGATPNIPKKFVQACAQFSNSAI
jgi:cobyrinic acid a,c-diamide synthase